MVAQDIIISNYGQCEVTKKIHPICQMVLIQQSFELFCEQTNQQMSK